MEEYDYFMVFELEDSGERARVAIDVHSQLGSILDPANVFVIVREELRRIYIWKGAKSSVRKRFISSRVASALQEELVKEAAFHRCKIVSIDQGDELEEFLNAFGLESMEVTEKLADMRYIRNIDRQKMLDKGEVPTEGPKVVKVKKGAKKTPESPSFAELEELSEIDTIPVPKKTTTKSKRPAISPHPYGPSRRSASSLSGLSDKQKKAIIDKIMDAEVPDDYKRQNLIIGTSLYGAVSKKVNVFGKEIIETEWEPVENLPNGPIEIDDRKLRIYLDKEKGIVEGVEVLIYEEGAKEAKKKAPKAKPATKKAPKAKPAKKKAPKAKPAKKKAPKAKPAKKKAPKKRSLPEIPKG